MLIYNTATVPASWDAYLFEWNAPISESISVQGDFVVTVTVLNVATPVSGVRVTVLSAGVAIRSGVTNSSGIAYFLLDAGTYAVNASTFGYTSIVGTALVVTAARSLGLSMVAESTTPVVPAGLCVVRFVVFGSDGSTPKVGATITAKLDKNTAINSVLLSSAKTSGVTDVNGACDLTLVQGASIVKGESKYLIEVCDASDPDSCEVISQFRATIPTLSFVYAEDLIV
jgi:hypothetical protein